MIKQRLASIPFVRPFVIRALKLIGRDVTLRNAWTGDKLLLNTFRHKGYWFYGRQRELNTMSMFTALVKPGNLVIEVGGHIGFITQFFSHLVGDAGRVIVFEPGLNNLRYISQNISAKPNIRMERVAVSDETGTAAFFEDNIGGQNNSLLANYRRAETTANSHRMKLTKRQYEVQLTTLDRYVAENKLQPDFLKIDIEGNEYKALLGARNLLTSIPALMVEVTENHDEVFDLLSNAGFELLNDKREPLDKERFGGNVFALRRARK